MSDYSILAAQALRGTGVVTGNITIDGPLAPGLSTGTQTLSITGGVLNLLFQSGFNTMGSVEIMDFDAYAGFGFSSVNVSGLAPEYNATFDNSTGIVTVIPEPRIFLIGGFGLLAVLVKRRK